MRMMIIIMIIVIIIPSDVCTLLHNYWCMRIRWCTTISNRAWSRELFVCQMANASKHRGIRGSEASKHLSECTHECTVIIISMARMASERAEVKRPTDDVTPLIRLKSRMAASNHREDAHVICPFDSWANDSLILINDSINYNIELKQRRAAKLSHVTPCRSTSSIYHHLTRRWRV